MIYLTSALLIGQLGHFQSFAITSNNVVNTLVYILFHVWQSVVVA